MDTLCPRDQPPPEFKGNGCGPASVPILAWLIPNWTFREACRQHDWDYFVGGTEYDRALADWCFLVAMLEVARWYQRPRAWAYYWAVRRWGGPAFTYREEPRFPGKGGKESPDVHNS